jgi:hypothetical protein
MVDDDRFHLELLGAPRPDVYVSGEGETAGRLVRALDADGFRVVSAVDDVRRVMAECSGVAAHGLGVRNDLRVAAELGLPVALVGAAPIPLAEGFVTDDADAAAAWLRDRVPTGSQPVLPYAFLIGRLERDFAHAREAIRSAVEREAGIPCLWSDDGSHRTDVASVRERTRLLIRDARFVIADLTLGPESPRRENPSRAHEIGMAIAYGRELLLCSQEPRRYPYFSVGDMQIMFWADERELSESVATWIRTTPGLFRRRVLNQAPPAFRFDTQRRFVGPNLRRRSRLGALPRWRSAFFVAMLVLAVLT